MELYFALACAIGSVMFAVLAKRSSDQLQQLRNDRAYGLAAAGSEWELERTTQRFGGLAGVLGGTAIFLAASLVLSSGVLNPCPQGYALAQFVWNGQVGSQCIPLPH